MAFFCWVDAAWGGTTICIWAFNSSVGWNISCKRSGYEWLKKIKIE